MSKINLKILMFSKEIKMNRKSTPGFYILQARIEKINTHLLL